MAFTADSNLCDVVMDHATEFPGRPAVMFASGAN
jgi:hypothetical protein